MYYAYMYFTFLTVINAYLDRTLARARRGTAALAPPPTPSPPPLPLGMEI